LRNSGSPVKENSITKAPCTKQYEGMIPGGKSKEKVDERRGRKGKLMEQR